MLRRAEHLGRKRRLQSRINAGERLTIGLVGAMRIGMTRAAASASNSGVAPASVADNRQFRAERMHIGQIHGAARVRPEAGSAVRNVPAVTNGLPSRSPPIQLPILKNGGTCPPPSSFSSET